MLKRDWLLKENTSDFGLNLAAVRQLESSLSFAEQAQASIFKSLKKVINSSYTRYELFMKLCAKLDKFFAINRASLAFYDKYDDLMKISHIKVGKEYKNGVQINIMASKTLMKRVLDDGNIYVRNFFQFIDGIELEKKILLDNSSRSMALIPLIWEDEKIGTFNLTSKSYLAFSLLESHLFDYLFAKTAEKLIELPQ
jgi:hypothetical protein